MIEPSEKLINKNSRAGREQLEDYCTFDYLADKRYCFYGEDYFLNMLRLERKRTERCRRPFCLMLMDLGSFLDTFTRRRVAKDIANQLDILLRETDIKGWYKHDSVIGVIFAETDRAGSRHLRRKIRQHLGKVMPMETLNNIPTNIYVFPKDDGKQKPVSSPDLPIYPDLSWKNPNQASFVVKRAIDLAGSIIGLVLFSPLFLIIPALIKATSEGPVLFRQERMGQYEKKFTFLKFRTMYNNNDPRAHREFVTNFICGGDGCETEGEGEPKKVYKMKDDPRITPLGRFLRKTSLDELPQFFNVLMGDMSLVGPRPPIPYEFENYDIWHRRRVMEIKPGITGLWQVMGRSSTTFDDMVRLDIKYSMEWSLWLDIKILFQTPLTVLFGKGAY